MLTSGDVDVDLDPPLDLREVMNGFGCGARWIPKVSYKQRTHLLTEQLRTAVRSACDYQLSLRAASRSAGRNSRKRQRLVRQPLQFTYDREYRGGRFVFTDKCNDAYKAASRLQLYLTEDCIRGVIDEALGTDRGTILFDHNFRLPHSAPEDYAEGMHTDPDSLDYHLDHNSADEEATEEHNAEVFAALDG